MGDTTLREARRLWTLGFAIHWVRPKSKVPLEGGWTTGPRKAWDELHSTYIPGMNVGVRLGTPSKIGEKYLAVLDVDIKSTNPDHAHEATRATSKIIGHLESIPMVLSGRGNKSRHYYFLTDKPFKTYDPATSSEIIRVKMPSKKISKPEREALTESELAQGWRLSPAWGISLYSDGRQVVLPPSIHPDTGGVYVWKYPCDDESALPTLKLEAKEESETSQKEKSSASKSPQEVPTFTLSDVPLEWFTLSEKMVTGVTEGTGVEDRSAFLLSACTALVKAGASDDEILSILTDPHHYLSSCAYEHAKTKNRTRAATWLYRYTLKKARDEAQADADFAQFAVVEEKALDEKEADSQSEELVGTPESRGYYQKGPRGALKPEYRALVQAFEEEHPYKTIADMKTVFVFRETHYEDITPIEIKAFAEGLLRPEPDETIRSEFHAKILANNIARREFFNVSTEGCVNFQNGVLNLNESSTELLPHDARFGFRGVLPFEYDPDARAPVFRKWLKGVMLGDAELIAVLQEFMGYIIRGGDYKYHKALWLGGVGRNGKSTFVDLLKALIGVGNYSVISIKSLIADKFAGASLDGKIANFSEETSPQELADSGPFKNLTGDGDIFAQKKYGDPYSFRNRAKLVMTYNEIPDLKDLSKGMLSRPIIIPFLKEIGEEEQDRDIKKKLFKELSGIFNFALEGWDRLEEQGGFSRSAKSDDALRRIKEESCNVYQWVEDHVLFEEETADVDSFLLPPPAAGGQTFRPAELYEIYKKHERFAFRAQQFYRRLNVHPKMKHCWKHTKMGNRYSGFSVI